MPSLSAASEYVIALLQGTYSKGKDSVHEVMGGHLVMPLREAQSEVQRRLRIAGVSQVMITVTSTYTALETTVDHESGTVRPLEMWERGVDEEDTQYRRMLESHDTQLDMQAPLDRLTTWRWDGGVVRVRPCTRDRSFRQRGYMVSPGTTMPWESMSLITGQQPDDVWFPVFHLAAASWLLSRDQEKLAQIHTATAERLLEQIAVEHAHIAQSRPFRRRPYYSR